MEEIRKALANMESVTVEESGSWLWISGDTRPHKEELKALGCRWSKKRSAWYWKPANGNNVKAPSAVPEVLDAEKINAEYTGEFSDGYLGAIRWDGSNAHKYLYGSSLTKELRAAFKKCGIKGVTVACKTYTGGQSLRVTVTPNPGEVKTLDEYKAETLKYISENTDTINAIRKFNTDDVRDNETGKWYNVWSEEFLNLPEEEKKRLLIESIEENYRSRTEYGLHLQYHDPEKYYEDLFSPTFIKKLKLIKQIVDSFNYNDTNSMVDYFDRGFYEDYYLKNAA